MMNDNNETTGIIPSEAGANYYENCHHHFNAAFDPRDGDPHHIAAQEDEEPAAWPEIALLVALLASVGGFAWWLS